MSNLTKQAKEELAALRSKKAEIERKIDGLERYLGNTPSTPKTNGTRVTAHGGVDIRPTVKEIFTTNSNSLLRMKDLVEAIGEKLPDASEKIIWGKMARVKRTMLENPEYGKYRLKAV